MYAMYWSKILKRGLGADLAEYGRFGLYLMQSPALSNETSPITGQISMELHLQN